VSIQSHSSGLSGDSGSPRLEERLEMTLEACAKLQWIEVFWFFFSKKNCLPLLDLHFPHDAALMRATFV
jgi:hypothetical protein